MAEKVLVDYIRRSLSRGTPIEEIEKRLSAEGWPQAEIEDAIGAVSGEAQTSRKASGKMWLAIIIATIIIGAGVMVAASFLVFGGFSFPAFGSDMSLSSGNRSVECGAQPEGVYRAMCYTDLAIKTGDVAVCNALQNTDERKYKDICVRDFAVSGLNESTCDLVESSYIKDQCMDRIADKKGVG